MLFTLGNTDLDPDIGLKTSLSKLFVPELFSTEKNIFSIQTQTVSDSENLFIVAQTVARHIDDSVYLGNRSSDIFISAKILYSVLVSWVSDQFSGDIYLYSATSKMEDPILADYAKDLSEEIKAPIRSRIFYTGGIDSDRIPAIGAEAWQLFVSQSKATAPKRLKA